MRSFLKGRVAPPLALFGLVAFAYWLYSLHTSSRNDPQDTRLAGLVFAWSLINVTYLLVRTKRYRIQLLGIIAAFLGDAAFYGGIWVMRTGYVSLTPEQIFDMLRACVSVAMIVYSIGILFFEYVQAKKRAKGERVEEGPPVAPDVETVTYRGPNRRGETRGRRSTDRGWGKSLWWRTQR